MVLHSRGCGRVARRRILSLGVPVERDAPGTPFFCLSSGFRGIPGRDAPGTPFLIPAHGRFLRPLEVFGRRKARGRADRSSEWMDLDAGKSANVPIPPVSGGFQAVEGLWAY